MVKHLFIECHIAEYAKKLFDMSTEEYDTKVRNEIIEFMKKNGYECRKIGTEPEAESSKRRTRDI